MSSDQKSSQLHSFHQTKRALMHSHSSASTPPFALAHFRLSDKVTLPMVEQGEELKRALLGVPARCCLDSAEALYIP